MAEATRITRNKTATGQPIEVGIDPVSEHRAGEELTLGTDVPDARAKGDDDSASREN